MAFAGVMNSLTTHDQKQIRIVHALAIFDVARKARAYEYCSGLLLLVDEDVIVVLRTLWLQYL